MQQAVVIEQKQWATLLKLLDKKLGDWQYLNRDATLLIEPIRNEINKQVMMVRIVPK